MKKIFLSLIGLYLLLIEGGMPFFMTAHAGEMPPIAGRTLPNGGGSLLPGVDPAGDKNAAKDYLNENLLPGLTNTFFIFLLSISVATITIAGIFYVISMGDSEKTKKAKDIILWTIVGVAIAAISYTLVSVLVNTNFK